MKLLAFLLVVGLLTLQLVSAKQKKNKKHSKRNAEYDIQVIGTIDNPKPKMGKDQSQVVHPDYPLMSAFKNEDIFTESELRAHVPYENSGLGITSKKNNINKMKENERIKSGKSLKERLEDKLEDISLLEGQLFDVIKDVKTLLKLKNQNIKKSMLPHLEELSKRSDLATITNLRKTVDTDRIIDDLLKDTENTKTTTGDTRDTLFGALSDDDPAFASTNEFVSSSEDTPISKIDEESERKDSMANARDIIQDGLVESPFSDLNFKKPSGKKSHIKVLS